MFSGTQCMAVSMKFRDANCLSFGLDPNLSSIAPLRTPTIHLPALTTSYSLNCTGQDLVPKSGPNADLSAFLHP